MLQHVPRSWLDIILFFDDFRSLWSIIWRILLCSSLDYSTVYHTSRLSLTMGIRAAFLVTYSAIVALRPRSTSVTPPTRPVCERLREFELWAPCRLRGSPKTGLRLVRRRGERASRRIQQQRETSLFTWL